jgi:metal-sulfur cluster biosynthetic enzyme
VNKEKQVYNMLEKVYDPELDQPLTELGFIDDVVIKDNHVEVVIRLPTYWCSPNFAYIMAEDIRKYVSEIKWVKTVQVHLLDHCASDEINRGASSGKSFSEVFRDLSDGDLEELRKKFDIKAYYARQEKLIKYLLKRGMSKKEITSLSLQELNELSLPEEGQILKEKYLEKKKVLNHTSTFAITTPEDKPLSEEEFLNYLQGAKLTRLSMEFNAHYCKGLLAARYNLPTAQESSLAK